MEIIIALLGLSFIVFVHELGHAAAASLLGVRVEVFSIGVGRPFFSFKWGSTQVRLSPFLFGGYCRMAGSDLIDPRAKEVNYHNLPEGSLLKAGGWRRALIYISGPIANVLLAFVVFTSVSLMGYSSPDYSTKVIAQEAHSKYFQTGDIIRSVDGKPVFYYTDLFKMLPEQLLPVIFTIERNGQLETLTLEISAAFFAQNVRPWIPLKVRQVQENSPAKLAGLRSGDQIVSIDAEPVFYFDQLESIKAQKGSGEYTLQVRRGSETLTLSLLTAMPTWGVFFEAPEVRTQKATSVFDAIRRGGAQTVSFMKGAFWGIWRLILSPFAQSGNILGPIGIASQLASAQSIGFSIWLQLIGLISASLAAMNLFFPISVLDGGQILIIAIEGLRRRRFTSHTLLRIHTVGVILVLGLLILGVFNDISFLSR